MDISTLPEVEKCGGRFFDNGTESDAISILKSYGMNMARLRLWNDPYGESGEPYGAGTCDLERTMELSKRLKAAGIDIMLDFHYSDFWADPGKQNIPKAWKDFTPEQLKNAVYDYTKSVMQKLKAADILPEIAAVGNELTNGMLWPHGNTEHFDNLTAFLNAGISAVKEVSPDIKIMIHLDNGGNNQLYRSWFDRYFENGGMDFDYIGLSYYPFWHGTLEQLKNNMNDLALRYHKDMIVAEVSTGFTLDDYAEYEKLAPHERKGGAANEKLARNVPYPMTKEGQCDFMRDFMQVVKDVPENRGKGFVYWEAAWIPVPGCGWATNAALAYTGEKGPCGNEWANQVLFDFDGNALPALKVIRDF